MKTSEIVKQDSSTFTGFPAVLIDGHGGPRPTLQTHSFQLFGVCFCPRFSFWFPKPVLLCIAGIEKTNLFFSLGRRRSAVAELLGISGKHLQSVHSSHVLRAFKVKGFAEPRASSCR